MGEDLWRAVVCELCVAMFCCNVAAEFEWFQANASKRSTCRKLQWLLGFVHSSKDE